MNASVLEFKKQFWFTTLRLLQRTSRIIDLLCDGQRSQSTCDLKGSSVTTDVLFEKDVHRIKNIKKARRTVKNEFNLCRHEKLVRGVA